VTDPGSAENTPESGPRYWLTWGFAVALAIVFVLACLVLYFVADEKNVDEKLWSRYVYLYGGLQAIVFTAVGWIFGREVYRTAAENATKQIAATRQQLDHAHAVADSATREVTEARNANLSLTEKAAHGRALAEAVRTYSGPARESTGEGAREFAPPVTPLKDLADRLFPPV
jgi:hypothetical protein